MQINAQSKYLHHSPRKMRLVANLIRPLPIEAAMLALKNLRSRAAQPVLKVLTQAVANAVNNFNLAKNSLKIQSIEVNPGPTAKRWQPVSRGRAHSVMKRTSHIKIILENKEESHGPKSKS
ncbi:MAG: 50S ribosomal protein L22 [Patescibacteria group bacterium]